MVLYKKVNGQRIEMSAEEEKALREEWARNDAKRQATEYQRMRVKEFPIVQDQLDMLWHELDATGSIATDGQWFQAIKLIKDKYPKPS